MYQAGMVSSSGIVPPQPKRCPLCGATVPPDPLGFYQCSCGWGGPGDPLEHDRGLSKLFAKMDREMADGQAQRDLQRLAMYGDSANSLNIGYVLLLVFVATAVYVVVGAIFVGCDWMVIAGILDQAWPMVIVGGIFLALILTGIWPHRRGKSIRVTREGFPTLMAALDEVGQRVGTRIPKRVMLTPRTEFAIGRRLSGSDVLYIGAATLPLLSDVGMKSILAHELAHARHGDTVLHRYSGQAEYLLHEIVYGILEGVIGQDRGGSISSVFGVFLSWTLLLPFRLLWFLYHLLRMHESRANEFAADRAAIHAYGPQAFIDALTGVLVAQRTFYRNSRSLVAEMQRNNSGSFYAEMRRHFGALPPHIISQLRVDLAKGFRTLANDHPTTPDRLRAAYATFGALPPSPVSAMPAYMLLTPVGATSSEAVEIELTKMLFNPKKK